LRAEPAVWSRAAEFVLAQQDADGPRRDRAVPAATGAKGAASEVPTSDRARGFAYVRGGRGLQPSDVASTGGMTACGVGTLLAARHVLSTDAPKQWAALDPARVEQAIHDGFAWLDAHWSPSKNPCDDAAAETRYHVYYLYCVERAMDLVGVHRLGKHLWYAEMAEPLLASQAADGSWQSNSTQSNSPVLDTCFALLFLRRATRGGIPTTTTGR
jgi:hypothetical protein